MPRLRSPRPPRRAGRDRRPRGHKCHRPMSTRPNPSAPATSEATSRCSPASAGCRGARSVASWPRALAERTCSASSRTSSGPPTCHREGRSGLGTPAVASGSVTALSSCGLGRGPEQRRSRAPRSTRSPRPARRTSRPRASERAAPGARVSRPAPARPWLRVDQRARLRPGAVRAAVRPQRSALGHPRSRSRRRRARPVPFRTSPRRAARTGRAHAPTQDRVGTSRLHEPRNKASIVGRQTTADVSGSRSARATGRTPHRPQARHRRHSSPRRARGASAARATRSRTTSCCCRCACTPCRHPTVGQ